MTGRRVRQFGGFLLFEFPAIWRRVDKEWQDLEVKQVEGRVERCPRSSEIF
jgi:hypothetical protein